MTAGRVVGREPRLELPLILGDERTVSIEFVIDTGFNGFLTLPPAAVAALGLPHLYNLQANFADDRTEEVAVFGVNIRWSGEGRSVEVLATGRRPLLGTALLQGQLLQIPFADGWQIRIDALP